MATQLPSTTKTLRGTGSKTRLVAVEDELGRFLKFYYGLVIAKVSHPRYISKIEFGLGTAQVLDHRLPND